MLKSYVTDLESVDEPLRAFYVERDGVHVLAVEEVDGFALANITGLKSALASERRLHDEAKIARRAAEESLARYGGMDPVLAQDALNRVNSGAVGPDVERLVAERAETMRAAIAEAAGIEARTTRAELDVVKTTLSKREAQLQRLARDNAMRAELDKVDPLPDAVDALMLMAAQHVKMVEEDGELVTRVVDRKGEARLDAEGRPYTVAAFMAEMRADRPALFRASKEVAGLGSVPQVGRNVGRSEANPYHPASRNLTKQAILEKNNPGMAARLRAEVGL